MRWSNRWSTLSRREQPNFTAPAFIDRRLDSEEHLENLVKTDTRTCITTNIVKMFWRRTAPLLEIQVVGFWTVNASTCFC